MSIKLEAGSADIRLVSADFGGSPDSSPGSGSETTRVTRLAIWIATFGLVVSSLAAYWEWHRMEVAADEAVANVGDLLTDSVSFAFGEVIDDLVAVEALYQASDFVGRTEFILFVEKLGVESGVQVIAFAPNLDPDEVAGFLDEVRETIPGYELRQFDAMGRTIPARPRETHVPLQWMYPEGLWENPYGFDLASFPLVTDSFSEADETGSVAATPFFRLPGGDDTDSLLLLQPIETIDTSDVIGYAVALVDLEPFLDSHLPRGLGNAATWEISDGSIEPDLTSPDWTTSLGIAGDSWKLAVAGIPGSSTVADPSSALFVLAAGIAASLLAAFGVSAYRQRGAAGAEVERLQELSHAKDRFLASVGHELRTPLTGVVGFTSLLRDPDSGLTDEEREKMIESIGRESTDLAGIIDDLLVAARSELDMVTVTSETVALRWLVENVIDATRDDKARGVSIVCDEDEIMAIGDPARIRQVVRNLLVNACRYGGDRIEARLARDAGDVVLQVADSGEGLSSGEWERIFEPYQRAHPIETMPAALGIGLSISRHLSRLMGGDLTYRHENGWSVFELRLQAAEAAQEKTPASGLSGTAS